MMNKWLNSLALRILAHVQERKSITFYHRKLKLSSAATAKAIKELNERGLVEKRVKGRECLVILTMRGQIAQEQLWALNRLLS